MEAKYIKTSPLSHPENSESVKTWPEFYRLKLLKGESVDKLDVSAEVYGNTTIVNIWRAQILLASLRRSIERKGYGRMLICRDGIYEVVNRRANNKKKEEIFLRNDKTASYFESFGNAISIALSENPELFPFIETELMRLEDKFRKKKKHLLKRQIKAAEQPKRITKRIKG